jgi:hypothetical protein
MSLDSKKIIPLEKEIPDKLTIEVFTKDYYDKAFEQIKQVPLSWNPSKITRFIREKLSSSIFLVQQQEKKVIESMSLYRARVMKEGEVIDEDDISNFRYPPRRINGKMLPMGRANRTGQQVFYASIDKHTTIVELQPYISKNESIVYLSTWGIKDIDEIVNMKLLFSGLSVDKDSYAEIFRKSVERGFNHLFQQMPESQRKNLFYAQKKYQELFTSEGEEYYHISSSIIHDIFVRYKQQRVNVPIVAYPSVAKKKESINFAIRKDFFDKHIYLKRLDKIIVKSIAKEEIEMTGIGRAIEEGGKLRWLKLKVTIKPINYKSVSLYIESAEEPKKYLHVQDNDELLRCCEKHAFSAKHYLENMRKLSAHQISEAVTKTIPVADFDEKHEGIHHMAIPTEGGIFLKTDKKMVPIPFVGINVEFTLEYI